MRINENEWDKLNESQQIATVEIQTLNESSMLSLAMMARVILERSNHYLTHRITWRHITRFNDIFRSWTCTTQWRINKFVILLARNYGHSLTYSTWYGTLDGTQMSFTQIGLIIIIKDKHRRKENFMDNKRWDWILKKPIEIN